MKVLRIIFIMLMLISLGFSQTTSQWGKVFRNSSGSLMTGNNIDLYEAGTANHVYDLTESITTPGYYYHTAVATGAYDVYVDGLITSYVDQWIGASKLTLIEERFNDSAYLNGGYIQTGTVSTSQIADYAITELDLGLYCVTPFAIEPNAVTLQKMEDNSVSSAEIVDYSIAAVDVANNAINTNHIASSTIQQADMGIASVGYNQIINNSIDINKMMDDAVSSAEIVNGSIVNADINSAAGIDRDKIDGTDVDEIFYPEYPNTIWVADAEYDSFTVSYDYQLSIGTRLGGYMRITADNAEDSNDRQICDIYFHMDPKGPFEEWGRFGTFDPETVCRVRFRSNTTNSSYADVQLFFWSLAGSLLYSTAQLSASSADTWQYITVEKTDVTTEDTPIILNIRVRVNLSDWDDTPELDLGEIEFYYYQN